MNELEGFYIDFTAVQKAIDLIEKEAHEKASIQNYKSSMKSLGLEVYE